MIEHRCIPEGECFCMYDPECNPDLEGRMFFPVDALLSDEIVDAGSWAETMDLGRIGTAAARAVLEAVAAQLRTTGGTDGD